MRWYAVHTKPASEATALHNLACQGYATYLPCTRRWVRHARRRALALRPLFPRYLFVGIEERERPWRPVLSTIGVADVVRAGDAPLPVAAELIDSLREREEAGEFDESKGAARAKLGDPVKVSEGPFADLVGRVLRADAGERIVILFEFLGRTVSATFSASALELV